MIWLCGAKNSPYNKFFFPETTKSHGDIVRSKEGSHVPTFPRSHFLQSQPWILYPSCLISSVGFFLVCPDLRCWLINCHWCQLRSQRSTGTLAGNQLFPNTLLERDGKALIDLVDGLSSGSIVLVSVTNDNLVDHDARLGGEPAERLPRHGDQT